MVVEFLDEQADPIRNEEKIQRVKNSLEGISAVLSCMRVQLADFAHASKMGANVIVELENQQKVLAEAVKTLDEVA